jgi:uncharacterized protein YkvS
MHKAPIVEERLKRTPKVGDIVKFEDPHVFLNWQNGATGIVTKLYHDGKDSTLMSTTARFFF